MPGARAILILLAGAPPVLGCEAGKPVAQDSATPTHIRVSASNDPFEWFLLPVEVGKEQGIWARHGLDPEFVPAARYSRQVVEAVGRISLLRWKEIGSSPRSPASRPYLPFASRTQ